jgi:hypothetical protein
MIRGKRIGAAIGAVLLATAGWLAIGSAPAGAATGTLTYETVPSSLQRLRAVACPSATECVAVGYDQSGNPAGATSTDGGGTWTAAAMPGTESAGAIACPTLTHCVAVGPRDSVDVTDNGGATWTAHSAPALDQYAGVACPTAERCLMVGQDDFSGGVVISHDGGVTWPTVLSVFSELTGIACPSTNACVVVGPGAAAYTHNGGSTWAAASMNDNLSAVSCASESECVSGGYELGNGYPVTDASTDGGANWSQTITTPNAGGNYNGIACPGTGVCAGVGWNNSSPMLAFTTDGSTWPLASVDGAVAGLYGVACPSAAWCLAVGDNVSNDAVAVRIDMVSTALGIDTPTAPTSNAGDGIAPLALHATDSWNGATLTFSATGLPAGLSLDPSTGVISGTPQAACACTVHVTVTDNAGSTASATFTWTVTAHAAGGYRLGAGDGGVFAFGDDGFAGSAAPLAGAPIVGIAAMPDRRGYWLVASDGTVRAFGDAHAYGNAPAADVVGIASTPSGHGYWLVARDGGVFAFGDARFSGSGAAMGRHSIVGIAPTPDGDGYWLVASDGGVFTFGDAHWYGSTAAIALRGPVVGIRSTHDGRGYWLVASDGGVFAFGDARFMGSAAPISMGAPIVGLATTSDDRGYWVVGADGGIFTFGDAGFDGSTAAARLVAPIVGIA